MHISPSLSLRLAAATAAATFAVIAALTAHGIANGEPTARGTTWNAPARTDRPAGIKWRAPQTATPTNTTPTVRT